ncbi:uncharacterized protein LOC143329345 [Chaetodon auriga]|uniref:uncharacterized protein LOC143329345 n=1 Tax=Chaetodon auriga TaxID=39042 RepID=UPI004032AE95
MKTKHNLHTEGGQFDDGENGKEAIYSDSDQDSDSRDNEDTADRDGRAVNWESSEDKKAQRAVKRSKLKHLPAGTTRGRTIGLSPVQVSWLCSGLPTGHHQGGG